MDNNNLERDMVKAATQLIEWLLYLVILCFAFGCSQYKTDITNNIQFHRSIEQFNRLGAACSFDPATIQMRINKLVGPIPTTQFEWQQYRKRMSMYGKYIK